MFVEKYFLDDFLTKVCRRCTYNWLSLTKSWKVITKTLRLAKSFTFENNEILQINTKCCISSRSHKFYGCQHFS
jgi:hypothetical protein